MKKIFTFLLFGFMIISVGSTVFADADVDLDSKTLQNFISDKNISEMKVVDSLGNLVDSTEIKNKLFQHDYVQVNNLLRGNKLSLSYSKEIIKRTASDISPYDISSNVEREFIEGHYGYDTKKRRMQEWITFMTVSYTENSNGTLTARGNPSISVSADFGGAWSTSTSNYRTGYAYKNGNKEIEFYGSYDLDAVLKIPLEIGGVRIPIGAKFDYGTIHISKTVR